MSVRTGGSLLESKRAVELSRRAVGAVLPALVRALEILAVVVALRTVEFDFEFSSKFRQELIRL